MSRGRKAKVATAPTSDAPQCPEWLNDAAKAEWGRVVPLLETGGVVQRVDLAVIAAYCSTFALWVDVQRGLDASVVVGEDGKLNPLARHCDSLLKQLRGLLDQLAFTPAARRQILTGGCKGDPIDEVLR